MAERDLLLGDLVRNILGPRSGPTEILQPTQDPLNEYITGVLAPQVDHLAPNLDQDDELQGDGEGEGAEEDAPDFAAPVAAPLPGTVSPSLDPRARPRTMGLSFVLACPDGRPRIEVCATWARYAPNAAGEWERHPEHLIQPPVDVEDRLQLDSGTDVRLVLRAGQLASGTWRVSVHLVNIRRAAGDRAETQEHVFQPEIRVRVLDGTRLIPLDGGPEAGASRDEKALWLLYRDQPAIARGHMCGATWREVDPQLVPSGLVAPPGPPFEWTDAPSVAAPLRARFADADVRTEFVPIYPVATPDMNWPAGRPAPELDPDRLAELWEPPALRSALDPLVGGYEDWIREREADAATMGPDLQTIANDNLDGCREVLARVRQGIALVCNDPAVRLAFCFANKAISVQTLWHSPGRGRSWRPFQLAFILLNVAGVVQPRHADREICDLLWIPTGGGKTEAYLGLAAFTMAWRRLRAPRDSDGHRLGEGVAVLSRYTLRLLTIQQFRRALRVVTACEYLRVAPVNGQAGWRPTACPERDGFIWGGARFGVGLWVGGGVTPNDLESMTAKDDDDRLWWFPGGIDLLKGTEQPPGTRRNQQASEPAQVLECPACRSTLAVPASGLSVGLQTLHFVFKGPQGLLPPTAASLSTPGFGVTAAPLLTPHAVPTFYTLTVTFVAQAAQNVAPSNIDEWWKNTIAPALAAGGVQVSIASARASRPGYFLRGYRTQQNRPPHAFDFDIVCPAPRCPLGSVEWAEKVPVPIDATSPPRADRSWQEVLAPFRTRANVRQATRVPIPACTVDDQVYRRCPSMIVATVDKFARLAFEGEAATLFGHVDFYHARSGFYREGCPPGGKSGATAGHPTNHSRFARTVAPLEPPQLIIQDELHLVEGPLGSMVGLYETVVEKLCERGPRGDVVRPKYVASTATVRQAEDQVRALFDRRVSNFPPPALSANDTFFARSREEHALDSRRPGRLYVGVSAPGWGALTPIVRVWSALLQAVWERRQAGAPLADIDPFWTTVGYFNAIRELAGAVALYRQDIRQRLPDIAVTTPRPLPAEDPPELSSRRADPMSLPSLLDRLEVPLPEAVDAVVATSMFGTGVDVQRLGLMIVHGQPKTTASYIQATGRVGRSDGGLVVALLRPARVRDLAHYEFFTAYHRQLYRHVEPVTVAPFAPRARERALGPLAVALLRQARELDGAAVHGDWRVHCRDDNNAVVSRADRMATSRQSPEVQVLPALFERRASVQPTARRPLPGATSQEESGWLDRWSQLARGPGAQPLFYYESSLLRRPRTSVVLGDPAHARLVPVVVFENAPTSLREVEATTTFRTR